MADIIPFPTRKQREEAKRPETINVDIDTYSDGTPHIAGITAEGWALITYALTVTHFLPEEVARVHQHSREPNSTPQCSK